MKDFRGIDLNINDTVAIVVSVGEVATGLTLGTIIGFSEQFGKEVCIVKYHPSGKYASSTTFKKSLTSSRVAKL